MATSRLATPITSPDVPAIRQLEVADLKDALRRGYDDFTKMPSHLVFLGLIYPVFGICLAALTFSANALPLLFPLVSGFALIGPFAAIGLYELSRRREQGLSTSAADVFAVLQSPALVSILAMGVLLLVVLVCWLATAQALYHAIYGDLVPEAYDDFLWEVVTTPRGWTLIVLGHVLGFLYALAVFSMCVVSFPMLLDRNVGVGTAILTSVEVVRRNPRIMATWALIIAALVMIGSAPLLVGLAIVLPVLGHASWHLYRRAVGS
ncbi:DUF2189 domain-containing protein [Enterovirga sp. CN4-39]|uniref:DUF2189 domain-containing protein n=1 Tax=Enterovirga sp. CN4-39 TaxID=3400910 RepID=UPI003BFCE5EC